MMTDELQNSVSEITEIPEGFGIDHFLASICWGTLTGLVGMLVGLMWEAGFDFDLDTTGAAIVVVGLIAGIMTCMGMFAIGLPLTWVLSKAEMESANGYGAAGALAGFFAIALIFETYRQPVEVLWFPAVGALAGFACAYRWGRWREALAAHRLSKTPTRRTNPIHDLTH